MEEPYKPDPFTNFTPRQNPPQVTVLPPIHGVIRSDMSKEEWNSLADTKLQELLQTSQGALLLAVIKESKDRIEGKPLQRQEVTADIRAVTVEVQALNARNEQIQRILKLGKNVK